MKSVHIWSYSGPCFPAFGLNNSEYGHFLRSEHVLSYENKSVCNTVGYSNELQEHDHEEADTLLILHAVDTAKLNPFSKCVVYSPDTDVFLLLNYHYSKLP